MTNTERLEYTFLRTEADNRITLFLAIDPFLLNKELDLQLTADRKITLSIVNNSNQSINSQIKTAQTDNINSITTFISEEIENVLYEHLTRNETLLVFCDKEANIISEQKISPFNLSKRRKP